MEDHRIDIALIASVGIDPGKTTFHLLALDCHARVILRKQTGALPWTCPGYSGYYHCSLELKSQSFWIPLDDVYYLGLPNHEYCHAIETV